MTVKIQAEFDASMEKIWEILTQGKFTEQYMFGCRPYSDWKKGSELLWKDRGGKVWVKGVIVAFEKEKELHYTAFSPDSDLIDEPKNYTTVTNTLIENNKNCLLNITQGDFSGTQNSRNRFEACERGWWYILEGIQKICASRC